MTRAECICDTGPESDGPDECCPQHGRPYSDWIDYGEAMRAGRERAEHKLREAEAAVAKLQRWKEEALPVMDGLQDLGVALRLPLGERITGTRAHDEAVALRGSLEEAMSALERVRTYAKHREAYGARGRTVHSSRIASDLMAILDGKP